MTDPAALEQVERFRVVVARSVGLHFDDAKAGWLAQVLERRARICGESTADYLDRLEAGAMQDELAPLWQDLTVAETYFFRNIDQFNALRDQVVPELTRAGRRRLRILSAGCASGEEAYTIAMTLHDACIAGAIDVSILGVDLNPAVVERARRARYTPWSLRDTSAAARQRWFRAEGNEWLLADSIRAAVTFEVRNLCDEDPQLWSPHAHDVVFCRNVLMYFTPQMAQAALARIARSLAPGGYLFLGHAETLRGLSQDFHLLHTHGAFYYQHKPGAPGSNNRTPPEAHRATAMSPRETRALVAAVDGADNWVEVIGRAAERVRALTAQAGTPSSGGSAPPAANSPLRKALALLRHEQFAVALDTLQSLAPAVDRDPETLLLRAVLLVQQGELARAEEACHQLLSVDELNAGAHYVLALCREGHGDRHGAVSRNQMAVYLDPSFAMPHLHLGLLARRAGDLEAQRRELKEALTLLQREDASRMLLFGGGFSRDALMALCRAELQTCGVSA